MKILRNLAVLSVLAVGSLLIHPVSTARADTCGQCQCKGTCNTYSCGFLDFFTCCKCNTL